MFMERIQRLLGGLGTKRISHRELGWAREMQLGNIPWILAFSEYFGQFWLRLSSQASSNMTVPWVRPKDTGPPRKNNAI